MDVLPAVRRADRDRAGRASCDVCGAGLRDNWQYCKQCGAQAAATDAAAGSVVQPKGFETIVGIPAVGTEVDEDEPFSNLGTGDLPSVDEVIVSNNGGQHRPRGGPRRAETSRTRADP